MRLITCIFVTLSAVTVSIGAAQQPDLDLSQVRRPPSPSQGRGAARGGLGEPGVIRGGISSSTAPVPISVRLLTVQPQGCSWLEPLTYDIQLQNISSRDLLLPWSINRQDLGKPTAGAEAFVRLTISLHVPRSAAIGTVEVLYGSADVPGSTRIIAPGETLVIRATSRCHLFDAEVARTLRKGASTSFQVIASVGLQRDPAFAGILATSSNSGTLTISR
jgi:hypothetical protein